MKTAMQQMIDFLQQNINRLERERKEGILSTMGLGALNSLKNRLTDAEELLEAEKEQIMEAFNANTNHLTLNPSLKKTAEEYYNNKFKS